MSLRIYVLYVTGSAKTSHVCTKTEIHFIAQDYSYVVSYTQEVSMHSVSLLSNVVCFLEGILSAL